MTKQRIVILLKGKIIEIGDDEKGSVAQLLRITHGKPISRQELINFFSDSNSNGEEIESVVNQLEEIRVLCTADNILLSVKTDGMLPFLPYQIMKETWVVRRGEKFFLFKAATLVGAIKKAKQMAKSWIDEVEIGVIYAMFNSEAECLPSKLALPMFLVDNIRRQKSGEIWEIVTAEKRVTSHPVKRDDNFWRSLIKRAVWDGGLVPIISEVCSAKTPFPLRGNSYLSCHKCFSMKGEVVDWQIGRDEDPEVAKGKAIMESLERYCGREETPRKEKVFASYQDLERRGCLNPTLLADYSQLQFKRGWLIGNKPFYPQKKMSWVKVRQWNSCSEIFIPDCFISFSYGDCSPRHQRLFYANSNGMAAHTEIAQAVKSGALEVVERDAIMIHWFNRITPPRIMFSGDEPVSISSVRQNVALCGYKLDLLDLTLDSVPVVMATATRNDTDSLSFFCGASAAESKLEAIEKAVVELEFSLWDRLQDPEKLNSDAKQLNIREINQPLQHELVYLKTEMAHYLRFLVQGAIKTHNFSQLTKTSDVFQALAMIGADVYYRDMTTRKVRNLDLNISVVKVLIPGFVPITFGYGYEPLAMERLHQLPFRLGLIKNIVTEQEMIEQYLPHFFA